MSHWRTALFLSIVPGLGHMVLRRPWRGMLLLALFALGLNALYFQFTMLDTAPPDLVIRFLVGGLVCVWLYSILHVAYLSRLFETARFAERKDYHFRRGITSYLAGAFDEAREEFLTVLRLDPIDIDARFHLGMTWLALGERKRALRSFKRCLAEDIAAKWKWEIQTELDKLK